MTHPPPIDTSAWQVRRFERGSRYYRLHLEQDLWGLWCLTRVYGRRGGALGRMLTIPVATNEDGLNLLAATTARRLRRGYLPVWHSFT